MKRLGYILGLISMLVSVSFTSEAKQIELEQIVDGTFSAKGMGSITPTADGIH